MQLTLLLQDLLLKYQHFQLFLVQPLLFVKGLYLLGLLYVLLVLQLLLLPVQPLLFVKGLYLLGLLYVLFVLQLLLLLVQPLLLWVS